MEFEMMHTEPAPAEGADKALVELRRFGEAGPNGVDDR